jgi:ubiquinol-cytochrome c reductase core subunit 2
MACSASKTPLLRTVASRGFAATRRNAEIQTTKLQNSLVVASVEANTPLSTVSIIFRAGARCETYDQLGASHVIRASAALSTANSTGFSIVNNLAYVGANLSSTSDREVLGYTVDLKRDELEEGLTALVDVSAHQLFKPWELSDVRPRVVYEKKRQADDVRAVDLLHGAGFQSGLGNSLWCTKKNVGRLSQSVLQNYVATNLTSSRAAVVGIGIDHQLLLGVAKHLDLQIGSEAVNASKWSSGDLRVNKPGDWASVAIGVQGASLANQKEALAFGVLQQIAGTGSNIKGGEANGALGKVISAAVGNNQFGFTALNASYADNGVFGVVLVAQASEIGKAVDATVKALKSGSVSSTDLARGKEQLKLALLEDIETSSGLIAHLGQQALLTGTVQNPAEIIAAIDGLSSADVNAAAKKVATGKWSVGAVGNLGKVPYANQLN